MNQIFPSVIAPPSGLGQSSLLEESKKRRRLRVPVDTFIGTHGAGAGALATLLFTDLVDSTAVAARLGDLRWRELLSSHFAAARSALDRFGGREVKTTGDGLLATFDGPARALRAATAIRAAARNDGLGVRAGIHVGEVELVAGDVRGVAVHAAARILAHAGEGEILASETTRLLAQGTGLEFEDRGTHELKGLDGEWRLFALVPGAGAGDPQANDARGRR
jgi:class 3 adenylate cyclase